MKLVPNWKQSWKWFTNWAHGAQALLLITWLKLPSDLRAAFSTRDLVVTGCVIAALGILGRNIDQSKPQ